MQNDSIKNHITTSGSYVIKTWCSLTGKLLWESPRIENLIVSSTGYGVDIVAKALGDGGETYPIEITTASIGSSATAVSASDTDLVTPVLTGILVADTTYGASGVVVKSFFINDSELANGTYREFGIYCSGRLFARSLISPVFTKSSNQNTSIDYTITTSAI